MVVIANITLAPVWLLSYYEDLFLPTLSQIGINEYLYNAILSGTIYYVVFGILPTTLFMRLKLINTESDHHVPEDFDMRTETFAMIRPDKQQVELL